MSHCKGNARTPIAVICDAVSRASSAALRYVKATSAPERARVSEISRPMRRAPPVTNAYFPASRELDLSFRNGTPSDAAHNTSSQSPGRSRHVRAIEEMLLENVSIRQFAVNQFPGCLDRFLYFVGLTP